MAKKFNNDLSDALTGVWTDYFGWGRATRAEYWWCFLVYGLVVGAITSFVMPFLSSIWTIAYVIPNFCLTVRRLHDTGRSGWNICWLFLPIIGWIVFLYFTTQKGSTKSNKYGPARLKR